MSKSAKAVVCLAVAALVAGTSSPSSAGGPLSAQEIMVKSEEARRLKDVTSEATITTTDGADTKSKTFTWWRKLGDNGTHFKTLTRFRTPAEVRGEGILLEERDKAANDVLLYLPTFKKTRRVEGQSQSSSFMGTVFSYSDIAQPHVDDYKHTLLRSEPCPESAAVHCFVIQSTPANDGVRERTGYSKTVQWVRSDNFIAVQAELADAQSQPWKRLQAREVREVDPVGHKFFAHELRIEDLRTKKKSVMQFAQVRVNTGLTDATFSQQNLGRE